MADIFVSYASEDRERILPLVESLTRKGFSVWWDRRIATGESFDRVIERELDDARCVLVIWSRASVESTWVRNEATEGLERGALVPVLIDDVRPPLAFRSAQTASLVGWPADPEAETLQLLLQDIANLIGNPSAASVPQQPQATEPTPTADETWTPEPRSIAILPFLNTSQDEADADFADGLTEELINLLSRGSDFRVAARTSAFTFKATTLSIETVARQLNVAFVMEGSVRKSGDQLRISAQLIDAKNGFQVWSESWVRTLDDVFQIQNEIAAATTTALSSSPVLVTPALHRTDPRAYELYLRSKPLAGDNSPEGFRKCEALLTEALAIDMEFAEAWSSLGTLMVNKAGQKAAEINSAFLFAIAAFERARRLDPQNANALSGLSWVLFYWQWQFEEAGRLIEQAYEMAPNDPSVLNTYATWLIRTNQEERALAMYQRSVAADPLAGSGRSNLAIAYINSGQLVNAELQLMEMRKLDADADWTKIVAGWLAIRKGEPAEALAEFQSMKGSHGEWGASFAFYDLGQPEASEKALQRLMQQSSAPAYQVASAYAYQGRTEEAFAWLDQGLLDRDSWMADLRQFFAFDSLHDDPRWQAVLQKVGLI